MTGTDATTAGGPTVPGPQPGRGPQGQPGRGEEVKRRAYLVVLALSTVMLASLVAVDGLDDPYWGTVYPTAAVHSVVLMIAVWRRWLTPRTIEALLLGPLVLVLLGFLATWRLAPSLVSAETTDVLLVMLWAGVAFPLCFLVFGTRRGLHVSAAIYAVFLLLVVPPAITGDIPEATSGSAVAFTLSLACFFAVMIALLGVLASRLEELVAARVEANLYAAQASTDPLTGLPNRRQLGDDLDREIALASRHAHPLSVVLVDIDRFKDVNDRFGHEMGDEALVEIAHRLSAATRHGDVAGRWGGEEFLLIAPHARHDGALELAERCRARVAATPVPGVGPVTASLGVATLHPGDGVRSLLARADLALYDAKRGGRDRVAGMTDLAVDTGLRLTTEPEARRR